jgi:hypothetical protein
MLSNFDELNAAIIAQTHLTDAAFTTLIDSREMRSKLFLRRLFPDFISGSRICFSTNEQVKLSVSKNRKTHLMKWV